MTPFAAMDTTSTYTRVLSVNEAADYLRVTPRTIRNYLLRKRNPLPHSKPAGKIWIHEEDLLQWLKGKK